MASAVRPQEASSSTPPCSYHVFLSFRGEDTRKTFTDHLYTALGYAGFRTFRDNEGIERGENIKSELQKAIQESRISIVVLSKNYASSSSCLDELVMILKQRSTSRHVVLPVFYDVDPSEMRTLSGCFEEAFRQHEGNVDAQSGERQKERMSKLEEWRAALKEVAALAGLNLQNRDDGHESKLIQTIVKVVGEKLSRAILDIIPYAVGLHFRAREIQLWLEDESAEDGVIAICGMGGIGKTTIAKFLYNLNFSRFQTSCFLENVRYISQQQDGLLHLQRQLLSDVLKGRKEKIYNVDEGIGKIKEALSFKMVLLVIDDVDKLDQIDAVLGMRDWLSPGSKIIITTRHEHLLRTRKVCNVLRVEKLNFNESFELFSLYAFGQNHPIEDYANLTKLVVQHCGGLPLAIKVLASSLSGKSKELWRSQLEKLKAIPDSEILDKLKISYDSLQDDHDKNLFLHLACFFVRSDKDSVVTILDHCDFFTEIGICNLVDRCLVTIESNKVAMHHLLQEMGREIVRQESPKEPGERSRLWNHKDSFNVLRQNTGTRKIEGLALDMSKLKEYKSDRRASSREEFLDNSILSNVGNSLRRYGSAIFSRTSVHIESPDLNQIALETDAFAKMQNLKLLRLGYVHLKGRYENFSKEIRWLCWRGFPFESIPAYFPLETLVALEMPYSSLKNFCDGTKFLKLLKILNLSHSHSLAKTPDFLQLPNLERLILEDCTSLVEVHDSIGHLERLVMLNLRDCSNLRKLPRSIGMLQSLRVLDISGCSNLEKWPAEMVNKDTLTVLQEEDVTSITRSLSIVKNVQALYSLIWPSRLMPKKYLETSWAASFPRSLVKLSLGRCNLSDNAFLADFSSLSSLEELDLTDNPLTSFPDFAKGLTLLKSLDLSWCDRIRSLVVPQELSCSLAMYHCSSLEKITLLSPANAAQLTFAKHLKEAKFLSPAFTTSECDLFCGGWSETYWGGDFGCDSLVEIAGVFKVEPIGNVDKEIIFNLGLFPLGSLVNVKIMLQIASVAPRQFSIQGCHDEHSFYTYVPMSKAPWCFNLTNKGSSIDFTVPHHDGKIQGLSLCTVYARSSTFRAFTFAPYVNAFISNVTKRLVWSHLPLAFAIPEADEDMLWLSYWKFENLLEGGDELRISVDTIDGIQVKEVGVHLVYKAEKTEEITQQTLSTSEEVSREIKSYGAIVPGRQPSFDLETTQVFSIGRIDFYALENFQSGYLPLSQMASVYDDDHEKLDNDGEFDDD